MFSAMRIGSHSSLSRSCSAFFVASIHFDSKSVTPSSNSGDIVVATASSAFDLLGVLVVNASGRPVEGVLQTQKRQTDSSSRAGCFVGSVECTVGNNTDRRRRDFSASRLSSDHCHDAFVDGVGAGVGW